MLWKVTTLALYMVAFPHIVFRSLELITACTISKHCTSTIVQNVAILSTTVDYDELNFTIIV